MQEEPQEELSVSRALNEHSEGPRDDTGRDYGISSFLH